MARPYIGTISEALTIAITLQGAMTKRISLISSIIRLKSSRVNSNVGPIQVVKKWVTRFRTHAQLVW